MSDMTFKYGFTRPKPGNPVKYGPPEPEPQIVDKYAPLIPKPKEPEVTLEEIESLGKQIEELEKKTRLILVEISLLSKKFRKMRKE